MPYETCAPDLPLSWERAIGALAGAAILPSYLGGDLCGLYRICREAERQRFERIVTATEHAWYLSTV